MTSHKTFRRHAAGFSLVTAVFLVVVLAGLGAAILNLSNIEHTGSALDVQGARAYQAARAGIEWGLYRQLRNGICEDPLDPTKATNIQLPVASTLGAFTVTVRCTHTTYNSSTAGIAVSPPITRYHITSVACNQPSGGACPGAGGTVDYVQRELQVEF
ncbi:agglutinin biogenesis protein MshP [Herbaspirillum sp. HC18]|nr:agglutinin biogenesis protein MshP [Herbaspirillum sp. HC18]